MKKSIFCLAPSATAADRILRHLKEAGFTADDISILFPDTSTSRDFALDAGTKAPEGASMGAGAGALLGGVLGWVAGIGALAIPGVGPLIAAGPIMAALSGAAVGGALGGITGVLVGLGIPEIEARRYEGKIREGDNVLVAVHVESGAEVERARAVFTEAHATDIHVTSEASV